MPMFQPVNNWYWLTVAMLLCFIICIVLMKLQRNAFTWYAKTRQDDTIFKHKLEHLCLYGTYISASICSLQCLLNHISNYFPEWYCVYGMSICVIFHEFAKTFNYGFFLQRAKAAIISTKSHILSPMVTNYILPVYISLYFILYCILCPLTFRGLSSNLSFIPTACLFDQYKSWVFYLSVVVEVVNSVFFVFVFVSPLYKIINSEQNGVIKIIKYNVVFSSISCISSVTFLIYRALSRGTVLSHYLWLASNIDLVLNAVCIFVMVTANRQYLHFMFHKYFRKKDHQNIPKDLRSHSIIIPPTKRINKEEHQGESRHISIEHTSLIEMDSLHTYVKKDRTNVQNIKNDPHFISEGIRNQTMTFSKNKTQISKPSRSTNESSTPNNVEKLIRPKLADHRSVTTPNTSDTLRHLSSNF
eukprot:397545_1